MNLRGEGLADRPRRRKRNARPRERRGPRSFRRSCTALRCSCCSRWDIRQRGLGGRTGNRAGRGRAHSSERSRAGEPRTADLPQSNVAQPPSDAGARTAVARLTEPSRTDALQAKLEALAKLRQPDAVTPSEENGAAGPDRVATERRHRVRARGPVQREGLHPRPSRTPVEFRIWRRSAQQRCLGADPCRDHQRRASC